MKCLIAMLFLAGSLTVGRGETPSDATVADDRHGPVPAKHPRSHPSYTILGALSLVTLLAWRRLQQSRS